MSATKRGLLLKNDSKLSNLNKKSRLNDDDEDDEDDERSANSDDYDQDTNKLYTDRLFYYKTGMNTHLHKLAVETPLNAKEIEAKKNADCQYINERKKVLEEYNNKKKSARKSAIPKPTLLSSRTSTFLSPSSLPPQQHCTKSTKSSDVAINTIEFMHHDDVDTNTKISLALDGCNSRKSPRGKRDSLNNMDMQYPMDTDTPMDCNHNDNNNTVYVNTDGAGVAIQSCVEKENTHLFGFMLNRQCANVQSKYVASSSTNELYGVQYFKHVETLSDFIGNAKARQELCHRFDPENKKKNQFCISDKTTTRNSRNRNTKNNSSDGITFLHGPSGVGKSLLLYLIAKEFKMDIITFDPCDYPNYHQLFAMVAMGLGRTNTILVVDPLEAISTENDDGGEYTTTDSLELPSLSSRNEIETSKTSKYQTGQNNNNYAQRKKSVNESVAFTKAIQELHETAKNRPAKLVFICSSDRSPKFHQMRHAIPLISQIAMYPLSAHQIMVRFNQLKNTSMSSIPYHVALKYAHISFGDLRKFESTLWMHLVHLSAAAEKQKGMMKKKIGMGLVYSNPSDRSPASINANNTEIEDEDEDVGDLGRFDTVSKILSFKEPLPKILSIVDKMHSKDELQAMSMTYENYLNCFTFEEEMLDAAFIAADLMSLADTFHPTAFQSPTIHTIEGIVFHTAPRYAITKKGLNNHHHITTTAIKPIYGKLAQHIYNWSKTHFSKIHQATTNTNATTTSLILDRNLSKTLSPIEIEFSKYSF